MIYFKIVLFYNKTTTTQEMTSEIILAFDTETTGLFPTKKVNYNMDEMPFITQLSFILYDYKNKHIIQTYNQYIRIPQETTITPFITGLTGVTREKCDNGVHIRDALQAFWMAYNQCDVVIAHNIDFDRRMMEIELIRNSYILTDIQCMSMFNPTYNYINSIREICTGNLGRNICNIYNTDKRGNKFKKMPKLSELYEFLFKIPMVGAHNSMYDTEACLKCYNAICDMNQK